MEWDNENAQHFSQVLPVAASAPPTFLQDVPPNTLIFRVTADDQPQVLFRTQLSELTTKEIHGPETADQRQQRLIDEELWQAIRAQDVQRVRKALADGALVIQPWMSNPPFKGSVLRAALGGPVAIVDALLTREPTLLSYFDFPERPIVWAYATTNPPRLELVQLLLKHGANPNYEVVRPVGGKGDTENQRMLFLAAEANDAELVRLLLAHGAEVNFTLADGTRFRDWVIRSASPDIRALLRTKVGG